MREIFYIVGVVCMFVVSSAVIEISRSLGRLAEKADPDGLFLSKWKVRK